MKSLAKKNQSTRRPKQNRSVRANPERFTVLCSKGADVLAFLSDYGYLPVALSGAERVEVATAVAEKQPGASSAVIKSEHVDVGLMKYEWKAFSSADLTLIEITIDPRSRSVSAGKSKNLLAANAA